MAPVEEVKRPPIKIVPSAHFFVRAIQRQIDDLSGIDALVSKLCQIPIGGEVAIKVGEYVFAAVRVSSEEAVLKTVYKKEE